MTTQYEWKNLVCLVKMKENKKKKILKSVRYYCKGRDQSQSTRKRTGFELEQERFSHEQTTVNEALEQNA